MSFPHIKASKHFFQHLPDSFAETVAEVGFSGDVFRRVNFTMEPPRFFVN
jgi:hypothetical protein